MDDMVLPNLKMRSGTPAVVDMPQDAEDSPPQEERQGHGAKSPAIRERVLVALLCGQSIASAAQAAGINPRTVRTWMTHGAFRRRFDEGRRAGFRHAMDRVETLADSAVGVLGDLLGPTVTGNTRLAAARTIIDAGLRRTEIDDVTMRLDDLERRVEELSGKRP